VNIDDWKKNTQETFILFYFAFILFQPFPTGEIMFIKMLKETFISHLLLFLVRRADGLPPAAAAAAAEEEEEEEEEKRASAGDGVEFAACQADPD